MNYKRELIAIIVLLLAAAIVSAQKPVKFTSVYTTLSGKDCKVLRGGPGTDDATECKGVGGYNVEVYYSAATMQIGAIRRRDEQIVPIATLNLDFNYSQSRLEWRLANGKPFAVLMRVPRYGQPKEGEYFGDVLGQQIIVAGLVGYDINEKIDAKQIAANAKAREAADKAFMRRK